MKTLGYIAKKYLLLFLAMLCTALPAQATNFDTGPSISAKAEYPAMLTGLPKEDFHIVLKIYNPFKVAEGSISFKTGQANHGDTDGVFIKNMHFKNENENFSMQITPEIKKEGYYSIKARLNIGEQSVGYRVHILHMDGKVFYSWQGGDIPTALALQRLERNMEYQTLKKKGVTRRIEFMGKSNAKSLFAEPFMQFLTEEERSIFFSIQDEEKRKVLEEINNKTAPELMLKRRKKSHLKINRGDFVTVKVRRPVDPGYTAFTPLQGAIVEIANIDDISRFSNGIFASGKLDENGEFKFESPIDQLRYRVIIKGLHDRYKITVDDPNAGTNNLVVFYDEKNNIDIREDLTRGIKPEDADAWSVFQAMYDLSEHVQDFAGLAAAPSLSFVRTNARESTDIAYYASPNKVFLGMRIPFTRDPQIVLGASNSYDWDVISHEYAHAVADQNNGIVPVGGDHTGMNQYDYAQNALTYQNKTNSNRLAFNEAFATWFGVSYWKWRGADIY